MRFSADCAPRGKRRSARYTSYSVAATAFLCLIPLSVAAQGSLEGTIRHAGTGAALSGAQVGLAELSLGGTTGPDGRYEVGDIPAGIHTIHIQLIGYASEVREVSVADGRTTHLDMELHETAVALEGLVAVGSRARPRTVTQSSVPIDAISSQDFIDQGDTDVNDLLRTVIPSFNVNPQATGDAAKIVRPASLRGLAPDHTLVLVNGKRRHRAAVILNYTVNDMVNVAGGAEFRDEYFEIGIGETASWEIGPFAPQGFSAGSNGFPGFSDIAAGGWHRVNYAVYGDVELRGPNDRWTVGTALRTERFEDFGTTANGKLAVRYALTDILAVRGSASTGFRAPTPGQQNAFNVSTQFDRTLRELVNNGTIPSTSRVAEVKGGRPLDAEKSVNASLGAVIDAGSLTVSADYFRIALSDRLALSQSFKLEPDEADRLIAEGITSAKNLANFRFFTNQFNTRTQGVDLVASFVPAGMGGDTEFSLAINHTSTSVTDYNPAVLDEVRIRQLEDALPGTRWTTSGRRTWDAVSLLGRLSYYAGWFDSRDDRDYPGEYLVDIEATYAVSESATISVGGQNALNQYPEENPNAASVAGNRYSPATPFGASGGFVYVKMGFSW